MQAGVSNILALTHIRRKRVLPVAGKVLVHEGHKVAAADVVAEAVQPGEHVMIDVRRALGLRRVEEAEKLLNYQPGDTVQQGDILAQVGGLFAHTLHAPISGKVIGSSAGRLILEGNGAPLVVLAGMGGVVREVLPNYGAIIETGGALVQGWLGNQQIEMGMLQIAAHTPQDELTVSRLDIGLRGAVVLGGHVSDPEVFRMGSTLPLRGLILSSITADVLPAMREVAYPVIVIEGFGRIPYNQTAYQILTTNERRDAAINASFDPAHGIRPEVTIALPSIGEMPRGSVEFTPGQTVRILSLPYPSQVGTLVQVRPGRTRLPNGVFAPAGDVRLPSKETVTVPLANLDVLE